MFLMWECTRIGVCKSENHFCHNISLTVNGIASYKDKISKYCPYKIKNSKYSRYIQGAKNNKGKNLTEYRKNHCSEGKW